MLTAQVLQKQERYGDNMKARLEKELDSMSQENWDELYIKLIDRFHPLLLLLDERHKYPYYTDKRSTEDLAEDLKLHRAACFERLAYDLSEVVKRASYEETRDLLLFALSEEVEEESGHYLCDAALLALVNELMGESNEAGQIIELFHSVRKWYS